MPAPDPPKPPHSRRIYVYWSVALTLLLAAGLFSWLVVVPVWQVHTALQPVGDALMWHPVPGRHHRDAFFHREIAVKELGGKDEAAQRLSMYSRLPTWAAPRRTYALFVLGDCGRMGVPALIAALDDHDELVRKTAAESLGAIGAEGREAVPTLMKALGDESRLVRTHAAIALGHIGPAAKGAISVLAEMARDGEESVRGAAVSGLEGIGLEAVPELEKLLVTGDGATRERAVLAVWQIAKSTRDARAVPALRRALTDRDGQVRYYAAVALCDMGPVAKEAAPALEAALRDKDEKVRKAAADALKKIRAAEKEPKGKLVENPVEEIRKALPDGWAIFKVKKDAHPWYRAKGKGTAVYLVEKNRQYSKAQFSAALFIMPPGYEGKLTVRPGEAQTDAPRLVATTENGTLYFWGTGGKSLEKALLKALLRAEEPK